MEILWLLYAHLLADYPLQGEFLAKMKGKNFIALASHAAIWTGTICIALILLRIPYTTFDIFLLYAIHLLADYCKAKPIGFYKNLNPLGWGLFIDQMIHVLQLIYVVYF